MNLALISSNGRVPQERRRADRRASPGLAACHWNGSKAKQDCVRDISATGLFLVTRESWIPGDIVALTLQRHGPVEDANERRVSVKARAVRRDENGVGLSFVLPAGMDLRLWDSPLMVSSGQYEPEDILREFHVARALAFVHRICPAASDQLNLLLREGLSNYRVMSATEIALRAEKMLAQRPDSESLRVLPRLVLRILEEGSWSDKDIMQQMWAGLLTSSCTPDGHDGSNSAFVELLCQLTPVHAQMLVTACTQGAKYLSSQNRVKARAVTLSAAEMMRITGSRDLIRVHRDLEYLSDLGLLTVTVRSVSFAPIQGTDIAATTLGLELYARCCGNRVGLQAFYHVAEAGEPGLNAAAAQPGVSAES